MRRAVRKGYSHLKISKIEQSVTDEISQFGYACGYLGSCVLTVVAIAIFIFLADVTLELSTSFGYTATGVLNEHEELWAKPVIACNMYFNNTNESYYLSHIQLGYDKIDINGSLVGSSSSYLNANESLKLESYQVNETYGNEKDYIYQIQLWYDSLDGKKVVSGIQFTQQSGEKSEIFGYFGNKSNDMNISTIVANKETDRAKSIYGKSWIFCGYNVYYDDNLIRGFEFLFMKESKGQYGSTISYRLSFLIVGVWWLFFQMFSFKYLKWRKKADIPSNAKWYDISVKTFANTIRKAANYPHLFRFLIAFFMFSDGVNTIVSAGILFGYDVLGMTSTQLVLIIFESEIGAAMGAVFFIWLQKKVRWNAKQMLIMHLISIGVLPIYTILGFIPNSPVGMVNIWEMFAFVAWFSFHVGSIQSYSRTLMSYLIPLGYEKFGFVALLLLLFYFICLVFYV